MEGTAGNVIRVLLFAAGASIVLATLSSAVRTFVLPRGAVHVIPRTVFAAMRLVFHLRMRQETTYLGRDRVMALYAPVSLLVLPAAWLAIVFVGFAGMHWAVGDHGWYDALLRSGSALLTLGFMHPETPASVALTFAEAAIGLALVSLFIAYLPTMYTAFSRRELQVTMLDVRAGTPPAGVELLRRSRALGWADRLPGMWEEWERWFIDVGETHTSLAALTFFRSPQPYRCWATAAGAVLDAAALTVAAVDGPPDTRPTLCLHAGQRTLTEVAAYFKLLDVPWRDVTLADPAPETGVHVLRAEFDTALDVLGAAGVPLHADRDRAWVEFSSLRRGYEGPLLGICQLIMAPEAPWSSDRVAHALGWSPIVGAAPVPSGAA